MTVREMVKEIQAEVRGGDLVPARACALLNTLAALMGNCNDQIRACDGQYAQVLLCELETCDKANRAKIRAECSQAYQLKREARDTKELVVEMIGALKYAIRSQAEEMRLAR